jgi:hypothetical protein
MPALVDRLGQYDGARFVIEHAGGAG